MFLKSLLDIPKSVLFNFYYLPFKDAIKFPFHVDYRTKIQNMGNRNSVILKDTNKKIRIGAKGSFALGGRTYWSISPLGKVIFEGSAMICKGAQVICVGGLTIGDGFYCNSDCIINCSTEIRFGENCLLGWKCTIIDGDGHSVIWKGNKQEKNARIIIGNHTWCASNVAILKGSVIQDDTVIAFGGIVSREHTEGNILIGGNNKLLKKEISWIK